MTILRAGTFDVKEYRAAIPVAVKLAVLIRQNGRAPDGMPFTVEDALQGRIQFDHDPALSARDFDTFAHDFIPPQLEVDNIVARRKGEHLQKTTGRREGADKTVTSRGSDIGEMHRTADIQDTETIHQAAMASKAGDYRLAARILASVKDRKRADRELRKLARKRQKLNRQRRRP